MKNTFKLMGLALLAGAMLFTACKKDEEDTDNNTNNTVVPAISVTFDGATWTSNEEMDYEDGVFYVFKTGNTVDEVMQFKCPRENGTFGLGDNSNFVVYWDDNDVEYNTYDPTGAIVVSSIDLTAKTLSATIGANFTLNEESHALAATLTNAKWVEYDK